MRWLNQRELYIGALEVVDHVQTLQVGAQRVPVESYRLDSDIMPVIPGEVEVEVADEEGGHHVNRHPRGHVAHTVASIVAGKMYNGYCVSDTAANRMVAAEMCREELTKLGVRNVDMPTVLVRAVEMVFVPTREMQVSLAFRETRYRAYATRTVLDETVAYVESGSWFGSRYVVRPLLVWLFGRRQRWLNLTSPSA